MVLTWCLLANAVDRRDRWRAGRSRGSRIGDTLGPRRLVAAARTGLREWGDPLLIWGISDMRANAAPRVDAASAGGSAIDYGVMVITAVAVPVSSCGSVTTSVIV